MKPSTTETTPRLVLTEEIDTLARLLLEGQRLLVRYPQAAQALISAFVAEGRQFAATPEGQAWKEKLAGSELVRRGRFIWDAYCLDAVLESGGGQIPSAWLDVILAAVANPDLETILSNLVVEEVKNGAFGSS
jgi:hypothetical protein